MFLVIETDGTFPFIAKYVGYKVPIPYAQQ